MNPIRLTLVALTLALAAGVALAGKQPATAKDGVLVGPSGMTLYTFDKDAAGSGTSACVGDCAKNWPPLAAGAGAKAEGDYTLVKRDDGSHQWAYKGKPLYYWAKDTKAGERTGDGVKGVWHLAKP